MAGTNGSLVALPPEQRDIVRPLFEGFPYLRGSVAALLEGGMGQVLVDDPASPQAALGDLDFKFLAGEPRNPAAVKLLGALPQGGVAVVPHEGWREALYSRYHGRLEPYWREAFLAGAFDRDRLHSLTNSLPDGYVLQRVTRPDMERFASDLHPALIYNWPSLDSFAEKGAGFGVKHRGRFASGASTAALGGGKAEFEVQTFPEFWRLGLATAASAALILYCLDHGLEPCWDAANPWSSGLARKLGFVSAGQYDAYVID